MHPSSLLLCTCPYQRSLDSLILLVTQVTPILLRIKSFLFRSLSETPSTQRRTFSFQSFPASPLPVVSVPMSQLHIVGLDLLVNLSLVKLVWFNLESLPSRATTPVSPVLPVPGCLKMRRPTLRSQTSCDCQPGNEQLAVNDADDAGRLTASSWKLHPGFGPSREE